MPKLTCLTEYEECCLLASYLDDLKKLGIVICYSHTAAGTNTPFIGTRMKNKAAGLRRGLPDFVIVLKTTNGNKIIFIELKREIKSLSTTYPEQLEWQKAINRCAGTEMFICYGNKEAIDIIEKLLKS